MALLAIPVEDARVASDLPVEYTFAEGLAGATLEELPATLAQSDPDPLAHEFAHLEAVERWETVKRVAAERLTSR
jgi:hypothetical protein